MSKVKLNLDQTKQVFAGVKLVHLTECKRYYKSELIKIGKSEKAYFKVVLSKASESEKIYSIFIENDIFSLCFDSNGHHVSIKSKYINTFKQFCMLYHLELEE